MKTLSQSTDNQLVQSFKSGDNQALEVLLARHKDKLYSSILFLVKDRFLSEDLFQDAFIKIIDNIRNNRYTEEGKFLPWAMRIAHNLCIDHFRKVQRLPLIKNNDDAVAFDTISPLMENAESYLMKEQSHDTVRHLLDLLPDDQREVIVLRHYADMSFKEIAETTRVSINTALGRMRYGLLNMRRMIAERQLAV